MTAKVTVARVFCRRGGGATFEARHNGLSKRGRTLEEALNRLFKQTGLNRSANAEVSRHGGELVVWQNQRLPRQVERIEELILRFRQQ